jgi:hypothetical protein
VAALDTRVELDELWDDFAVDAVIPQQGDYSEPVETSVVWIDEGPNQAPGGEFQMNGARRIAALRLDEAPRVPLGLTFQAAEYEGGTVKTWRVDGFDRWAVDHVRALVVEESG